MFISGSGDDWGSATFGLCAPGNAPDQGHCCWDLRQVLDRQRRGPLFSFHPAAQFCFLQGLHGRLLRGFAGRALLGLVGRVLLLGLLAEFFKVFWTKVFSSRSLWLKFSLRSFWPSSFTSTYPPPKGGDPVQLKYFKRHPPPLSIFHALCTSAIGALLDLGPEIISEICQIECQKIWPVCKTLETWALPHYLRLWHYLVLQHQIPPAFLHHDGQWWWCCDSNLTVTQML